MSDIATQFTAELCCILLASAICGILYGIGMLIVRIILFLQGY